MQFNPMLNCEKSYLHFKKNQKSTTKRSRFYAMTFDLDGDLSFKINALEQKQYISYICLTMVLFPICLEQKMKKYNYLLIEARGRHEGVRVPLIVAGPGIKCGSSLSHLSQSDLLPITIVFTMNN